ARFDVSRVTVRKSLEILRGEGRITSRQGLGWTVSEVPVAQPLDSLVPIERRLAGSGRALCRQVTDFGIIDAPPPALEVLGPRVLEVGRLNLVDDEPFSHITVWCRESLATDLSEKDVETTSFLELLGPRLRRAVQTIGAQPMPHAEAKLLRVPAGSPALLVRRTTYDGDDQPLFMSEQWFPGHLTEFVAELSPDVQPDTELRFVSEARDATSES
ncbi:MAG: GntR family transcriptional regulator, partial [Myxococcota bacterium]